MALIVQKYGGTSVGSIDRIKAVAARIAKSRDRGDRLVVVVSAMAGETNRLFKLASELCEQPDVRETDVLVATGEQVSAALLSIRLQSLGYPAVSFLGFQMNLATDSNHGRARIKSVHCDRVKRALDGGRIVVVAGYQGVNSEGDITTLGRGASDLTAVALAAALKADACEIYTDVDGVYTADPRVCPKAQKLGRISYDEMLEMAGLGAKVLQLRSVELARRYNVPLVVRSSFNEAEGTWVGQEDKSMEDVLVSGVTLDQNQSKVTIAGVEDRPGLAARIFVPIAEAGIVVDMIIQNASADGRTDMTFTVGREDLQRTLDLTRRVAEEIGAAGVRHQDQTAKVSVVGLGMRSHAGVAARMFQVLANERINIEMIATSEIKVSVVVNSKYGELAMRALHDAFINGAANAAPAETV
ncbi:MAG: aspartate kinase [Candidatus Binatus sp.]|uniref:aspartate kinase n=1 Tax=Candidatus Binatus sp. TaxID=2811406 RepID=UPI00271A6A76|nr:aspartate kinase [Candidatus Binatus sp.]MDO8434832.1 aspartate kinase [Candidatus Binatus sp.]